MHLRTLYRITARVGYSTRFGEACFRLVDDHNGTMKFHQHQNQSTYGFCACLCCYSINFVKIWLPLDPHAVEFKLHFSLLACQSFHFQHLELLIPYHHPYLDLSPNYLDSHLESPVNPP